MAGMMRYAAGVVGCLCMVTSVSAFGWRSSSSNAPNSVTYSYYPYYSCYPYYYVWPSGYCVPVGPKVLQVPDARPTPAPPSSGEAPLMPPAKSGADLRAPIIIATKAHSPGTAGDKDRCRVGFWNLSGRDVTLTVDGKSWTLPRNRELTLAVERQFGWRVDQQPMRTEQVPTGQGTFEVLIRE